MRIQGNQPGQFVKQPGRTAILFLLLIGILVAMFAWQGSKSNTPLKVPSKVVLFCDAEKSDGKHFLTESFKVSGGKTSSPDEAYSGQYASKIGEGVSYGMGFEIPKPTPGKAYRASVWMYRTEIQRGRLVVSGENSDTFYKMVEIPIRKEENGWELLRIYFVVPDFDLKTLKIYAYAPEGAPPIYFDDLLIEEIQPFLIPPAETSNSEEIRIAFPMESIALLKEKETEARQKGILITEDSDWVEGIILDQDGKELQIEARLKGDYLDHLSGKKWSLRIKTANDQTWNRMRTFSIQSPHTRSYLSEWIYHLMLMEEDILAPRYDFHFFEVDSLQAGIYALEEHFEKHLLEDKFRREGPILKLAEDGFWLGYKRQNDLYGDEMLGERMDNAFWKSDIKPFKENRLLADPVLSKQYAIAQNQLFAYKYGARSVDEVFDLSRLAAMYAIMDINDAYHGKAWHNQRFYYNPVTTRLEPIGFDGFGEHPVPLEIPFLGYYFNSEKEFTPFYESPFQDSEFYRLYCQSLSKWSHPDTLDQFLIRHHHAIEVRVAFLRSEYPDYNFDEEVLRQKARKIRALIEPYENVSLIIRTREKNKTDRQVLLYNKHCLPLEVVGYGTSPDRLSVTLVSRIYVPQQIKGAVPKHVEASIPTFATHVFFSLAGTDTYTSTSVSELPGFELHSPAGQLQQQIDTSRIEFISRISGDVVIQSGAHRLDKPLVIRKNEQLIIQPGTELDLVNGAFVLSYGPVTAQGTTEQPIRIFSSDLSAQGFTVLQASAPSQFSHTTFQTLNTLSIDGWELTGAVNLYESDVVMKQCEISHNLCEDALNIIRSHFDMEHINIHHTKSDGFDADFCTGEIRNSTFSYTGNDGMDFSGSQIIVGVTRIDHAGDKGISVGEESNVLVWNALISASNIAVASKDLSELKIHYIELNDCKTGYAVYQKKPEFGPAKLEVVNEVIQSVRKKQLIETGSILKIGEREIKGNVEVEI